MSKKNFGLPFNNIAGGLGNLGQLFGGEVSEATHINPAEAARTLRARSIRRPQVEDDWRARPTLKHPYPVVLIHGTSDNNGCWEKLAPQLRRGGYCVFAPNYGHFGEAALNENAAQVEAFLDAVVTITGAEKLILIGHSQGGLLARYYAARNPGKVAHVIAIAATNQRTTVGDFIKDTMLGETLLTDFFGVAGWEQMAGSPFYQEVEKYPEVTRQVSFTCIASRADATVIPPTHCFLEGAKNIWVQDVYPTSRVPHTLMPVDRRVRHMVMKDLREAGI
ncbi:MAG: alpha/beta fold hydrolase [Corynebacterium sp.]|nr:alpha/beta fold hydrolase [Corynebacterium sp.]